MSQEGKRLSALQNTLSRIAATVKTLNEAVKRLTTNLRQFGSSAKSFEGNATKASQGIDKIGVSAKKTGKSFGEAQKGGKGFFSTIGANIKTILRFYGAFLLISTTVRLLKEVFISSSQRAIKFEKALADLSAVAGLTNKELGRLEGVALKVAGSTSLTTLEVVDLQKQLAKLGSSTEEIENLTRPVALLAQALGEDPGGVANALKKTLNVFGETSASADSFANIMTGAVNETALSLQDLGTGLQYVGPIAKQSGLSFQETSALLGVLADNGFKASRAGTGLRQFLITAAKDGRPFNEFLDDLAGKNISLTRAVDEFKKTGASQALVIAENVEQFRELAAELDGLDRLFEANAKQMGTYKGQLDLISSAYDNFSTRLGTAILNFSDANGVLFDVLELLDPATSGQARAFQVISRASVETREQIDLLATSMIDFGNDPEEALLNTNDILLDVLESSGNIATETLGYWREYAKDGGDLMASLGRMNEDGRLTEDAEDSFLLAQGLVQLSAERATQQRNERISLAASVGGYSSLLGVFNELQLAADNGTLSEEKRVQILKDVIAARAQATQEYNDANTVEERLVKQERMNLYQDLYKSINGLENDTAKQKETLDAADKKRIKELIDLRQQSLEDELTQLKTIRDAELLRVSTIEDLADREGARAAAQVGYSESVSQANKNAAIDIRSFTALTEESKKAIIDAAEELEKIGKITGSDGISVFSGLLTDFASSQAELDGLAKKSRREGGIGQKEYEKRVQNLRDIFKTQINALITDLGLEGQAAEAIRSKTEEFLNKPYELRDQTGKDDRNALEKLLGFDPTDAGEIDKYLQVIEKALSEAGDVYKAFNDTRLENLRSQADAELDIVKQRYDIENDILKAQLDNQLITEGQFRLKQTDIRRKQIAEENKITKNVFESEKKADSDIAVIEGLEGIATATINAFTTYPEPITASLVAAAMATVIATSTAAKVSAINQRQFAPKKFATGGVVNGPSHDQGGVPFTVQGTGGYEMEGGEFIINKRAAALHRDLLETINGSYKSNASVSQYAFADGGIVNPIASRSGSSPIQRNSEESVSYLKAIAEASVSTAINSNKPIRAFVTTSDLRRDDSARRIKDSNTTI
tara:strand:- start:5591 stop:8935 length:3345 start_codon:yes stop_codon:yes gene_type:complete